MTTQERLPRSGPRARPSIQVIARAAAILRALQVFRGGLSLAELAYEIGVPRSTVQRIVDALAAEGLLLAPTASSGARLGPALIPLGAASSFPIAELARPALEALAIDTGESVALLTLNDDRTVVVDRIDAAHRLVSLLDIGATFPLHCSASGKAILAALSPEEFATLKDRIKLTRHTNATITSWSKLAKACDAIRESGLAYDKEEHSEGVCSMAVVLHSSQGELMALAVTAPRQRFLESEQLLTTKVLDRARALQQVLDLS